MASFVSSSFSPVATLPSIPTVPCAVAQLNTLSPIGAPKMFALRLVPKIVAKGEFSIPSSYKTAISWSVAQPETLKKIVQTTMAKQLSIDESSVAPETKFADLGADSLDAENEDWMINMVGGNYDMMALEEKFGFSIGGGAENIATVQDAADLI
ncbi:Phosphopantetheine binding ACP domain [Dillenia turbinata]|uniref:Phosphopantetheine binding ACP domain n=1 Tax=Dillenia turbinata TaxID=194707 RepID=A0AAN8UFH5_9MAGN